MTETEEVRKKFEELHAPSVIALLQPFSRRKGSEERYAFPIVETAWQLFSAAFSLGVQDGLEQAANAMEGAAYSLPTKTGWTSTPANYLLEIRDALLELKEGNAKAERG